MSAAVDIFGHIIGGRFLYAAATAEDVCHVFSRVPIGPASDARAAAAPTGARLYKALCAAAPLPYLRLCLWGFPRGARQAGLPKDVDVADEYFTPHPCQCCDDTSDE